jgi:hypothetical protein
MIRFRSYIFIFSSAIFLIVLASSCNKQLEIESSAASSRKVMWQTYDDAKAGLVGMYGLTRAALAENNAHWLYGDLRMGDFTSTTNGNYLDAIIKNDLKKASLKLFNLQTGAGFMPLLTPVIPLLKTHPNAGQI